MSQVDEPPHINILQEEVHQTVSAVGPAVSVSGGSSSSSPSSISGGLVGIIIFLVLLLAASAIAFFFIRRHFQKTNKEKERAAGGVLPTASTSTQTSQTSLAMSKAAIPA
ncbi:hypothetical protein SLS62_005243 [Diatrype stigma]|uniref:Uncharacterized protein n=1 Tax=Diatrype stigma TaxID=117547 RepID=A0AAN9YPS8_9PEZI